MCVICCKETVGDPVRNDVKMNQQMKADTSISSQGLKYSLHKATGEAENVISSCNPIAHAVLANKNSTSISSIRSLAEVFSNVCHPLLVSLENRAAVPSITN